MIKNTVHAAKITPAPERNAPPVDHEKAALVLSLQAAMSRELQLRGELSAAVAEIHRLTAAARA